MPVSDRQPKAEERRRLVNRASGKTIKVAWQLVRRSNSDPLARKQALAELLRAQGYYVISH